MHWADLVSRFAWTSPTVPLGAWRALASRLNVRYIRQMLWLSDVTRIALLQEGACECHSECRLGSAIMGPVIRRASTLAAGTLLLACSLLQIAADDGLPGAWRQGIATNYGGAQDGMVRDRCLCSQDSVLLGF